MKEKFEKDYKELQELNLKNKKLFESLNKEFETKCNSFLDTYNLKSKINNKQGIETLLNKDLSYSKLLELLNLQTGCLGFISSLKDHMDKTEIQPKLLDYNLNYINYLENKFKSLDSIENIHNTNNLFTPKNGYMIDYELEKFFKSAQNKNFKHNNNDYVYMVIFNKVKNKNKDIIIYNYIPYNKVFLKLLYIYIEIEQLSSMTLDSINKDFFFIIDSSLMKECDDIKSNCEFNDHSMEIINFIHLMKLEVKGKLLDFNYKDMGNLIKWLNDKNEVSIFNLLTAGKSTIDYQSEGYLFNYISKFLFLVSDLDTFIKSIHDNVDIDINQGPQKDRGRINYISHTLIHLDKAFRDSLYNHNREYVESAGINQDIYDRYIPRSMFSFRNIHINMGKVRWYSK